MSFASALARPPDRAGAAPSNAVAVAPGTLAPCRPSGSRPNRGADDAPTTRAHPDTRDEYRRERTSDDESTAASSLANAQLPPAIAIANLAPQSTPVTPATTTPGTSTLARAEEVQALASVIVERAAFWGDGTRGVARLRLGARASRGLASATVVLEHDGDRLRLRLEGASDEASEALVERLRARGIEVEA